MLAFPIGIPGDLWHTTSGSDELFRIPAPMMLCGHLQNHATRGHWGPTCFTGPHQGGLCDGGVSLLSASRQAFTRGAGALTKHGRVLGVLVHVSPDYPHSSSDGCQSLPSPYKYSFAVKFENQIQQEMPCSRAGNVEGMIPACSESQSRNNLNLYLYLHEIFKTRQYVTNS